MTSLDGQVALVTGGASGIGRATALELAAAGANVAVVDRDAKGAEQVATEARALDRAARSFAVDLADGSALVPLVERIVAAFGRIDILVNCAGISGVSGEVETVVSFTDEALDTVVAVNLRAPYVLTREVGNHMIDLVVAATSWTSARAPPSRREACPSSTPAPRQR